MKDPSKMKTFLIPFTIVLASIITAESAHVGFRHWIHDVGDLKTNVFSKPQEQDSSPTPLSCFQCPAVQGNNETTCTAAQELVTCNSTDDVCAFFNLTFVLNLMPVTTFVKGCLNEAICSPLCQQFNDSIGPGFVSCNSGCCSVSGCNPVCSGPLTGSSGVFTSPNFPDNYNNLDLCIWTITLPAGQALRIEFTSFDLQFCKDFLEFFVGGQLRSRLTGRGIEVGGDDKRSLDDKPSNDDECGDDDDDKNRYYVGDDDYYYDLRRRMFAELFYYDDRRRRIIIQGNGQEIRIVFRADASVNRRGFRARFSVQQGGGGTTDGGASTDSGGSSDEEYVY